MQFDLFDQGGESQPGGRQTDLEMLIEENRLQIIFDGKPSAEVRQVRPHPMRQNKGE